MSAEHLARMASSTVAARATRSIDMALLEYTRRYGDTRFKVTAVKISETGGIEFTVKVT